MKKFAFFAVSLALATATTPAIVLAQDTAPAATIAVNPGKMLFAANGQRIGSVYRVTTSGDPQVILNGKLVTIPAATLSDVGGKLTTSLTKAELGRAR